MVRRADTSSDTNSGSGTNSSSALDQATADALPVMVALVDREQRYIFIHPPVAKWFERPRSEILGRPILFVTGYSETESIRRLAPDAFLLAKG